MFVKFATTNGKVFQETFEQPLNIGPNILGEVITFDDGIIIVDRDSTQHTTQLETDDIISLLRLLLQKLYTLQVDNIIIYLPRMYANINDQAMCQAQFQQLSSQISNGCREVPSENIFNISLVHV